MSQSPSYKNPGPCIYYLWLPRAGEPSGWDRWLRRARELGCDWLYLGGIEPLAAGSHPFASERPGGISPALAPGADAAAVLARFVARAHRAGMRVACDFVPAFVARDSPLARRHPGWWVKAPFGDAAVPGGISPEELSGYLVESDFCGESRDALVRYWGRLARERIRFGFDALVCRAAQRIGADEWRAMLRPARRLNPDSLFWAETLGARIEQNEALAAVGFQAFFSSLCWWDLRADWFLEQESRLRRLAPTISFPEEIFGPRLTRQSIDAAAEQRARFRYRLAAVLGWGVILPMGYARGWRQPLIGVAPEEPDWFNIEREIAAVNACRRRISSMARPAMLERISPPDAAIVAFALRPLEADGNLVLIGCNPDPVRSGKMGVGPVFTRLDVLYAAAREITPGRSPQRLRPEVNLVLEPEELRWFVMQSEPRALAVNFRAPRPPPVRCRDSIAIEAVEPTLECGRFAVKHLLGDEVRVQADIFAEGHGRLAAVVSYSGPGRKRRHEAPLVELGNDRWEGIFVPDVVGEWQFRILAWRDRYAGWREDCLKCRDAGEAPGAEELGEGERLLSRAAQSAHGEDGRRLRALLERVNAAAGDMAIRGEILLNQTTTELVGRSLPRAGLSESNEFRLQVERGRAACGAWYEVFPRSLGSAARSGNFADLGAHLPYIAGMGFDVVYLSPIHPLGRTHRKGRNNALRAGADDPGSPWAIGGPEGGHTAVHPDLGTLEDFRNLLVKARRLGLEIALDFAIQCSPDHPWIREHPEWFRWREDGTIRYAENPPKKYEDIVNVDFYSEQGESLWLAWRDVLLFWCAQGVGIFRVDNPHTKPFRFWEWVLGEVRARYPRTVFLAEAFTRPRPLQRLAKLGFSQSYTYFIWRNTKQELIAYLSELTTGESRKYLRPNFWVNTPDINPYFLQQSGRAGFVIRAVLAATLAPSWGMYSGYELGEATALQDAAGTPREEYQDSEKYQFRHRVFDTPGNICAEIFRLNTIRKRHPAFSRLEGLCFHTAWNDRILFYSRRCEEDLLWLVVSLDPHDPQEADLELPLESVGASESDTLAIEDLLSGERWHWQGRHQHLRLEPQRPAMILVPRKS